MTLEGLQQLKTRENIKLDTAIAIRKLIDKANEQYLAAGGDADEETTFEECVLDMLSAEDDS